MSIDLRKNIEKSTTIKRIDCDLDIEITNLARLHGISYSKASKILAKDYKGKNTYKELINL